jgi:hypothetical protein
MELNPTNSPSTDDKPSCSEDFHFDNSFQSDLAPKYCSLVIKQLDSLQDQRAGLLLASTAAVQLDSPQIALDSGNALILSTALELTPEVCLAASLAPVVTLCGDQSRARVFDRFGQQVRDLFEAGQPAGNLSAALTLISDSTLIKQAVETSCCRYSLEEIQNFAKAVNFVHELYNTTHRNLDPERKIYLFSHAIEVGFILLHSKVSEEIVVAGILHDALEAYADKEQALIAGEIANLFGIHVLKLVDGVTELPKNSSSWWDRKMSVITPLLAQGSEIATIVAASKISTLASGVRYYQQGHDNWSAGSLAENVQLFEVYDKAFESKNIPPIMLRAFREELNRLRDVVRVRESHDPDIQA